MEVFMKGIFNKMLVAALLISVVPGVYAMGETMDLKKRNIDKVIENNDEVGISVDEVVSRFRLLDKTIGASSAVMYVADEAYTFAKNNKYVVNYLLADAILRGKSSFVGSVTKSLCSVEGLVGLATAYGVYKASGYYTDTLVPKVSGYYSDALGTMNDYYSSVSSKATNYSSQASSFFSRFSNAAGKAYEEFNKPSVVAKEDIEMVSAPVTPVATPSVTSTQRSRSASSVSMKPLPLTPAQRSRSASPAPTNRSVK
jgi:hypothetical protein